MNEATRKTIDTALTIMRDALDFNDKDTLSTLVGNSLGIIEAIEKERQGLTELNSSSKGGKRFTGVD